MSDEITRLEHSGFVLKSSAAKPRPSYLRRLGAEDRSKRKKRPSQAAVYLTVRLGVCVLLFCTVLALRLSKSEKSVQVLSLLNETSDDRTNEDTGLGRLRFVQIPSIIEVFAPSDETLLPVEAKGFELLDDETLLALSVNIGEKILSPCAGMVLNTGEDTELGSFVAISAGGDLEYRIIGISDTAVEKGQPLAQNSILGITSGQTLYIRAFLKGSPENPLDYFHIDERR